MVESHRREGDPPPGGGRRQRRLGDHGETSAGSWSSITARQYRLMTNDPPLRGTAAPAEQTGLDSEPALRLPISWQRQRRRPVPAGGVFSAYAAGTAQQSAKPQRASLSIMRNVSVPFGAPYGEFGIYNTEYRTVARLDQPPLLLRAGDNPEPGLGWAGPSSTSRTASRSACLTRTTSTSTGKFQNGQSRPKSRFSLGADARADHVPRARSVRGSLSSAVPGSLSSARLSGAVPVAGVAVSPVGVCSNM